MQMQTIAVSSISIDAFVEEDRTFNREFAKSLAQSIKSNGMLQPPIVVRDPKKDGDYKAVAGKHRLYSVKKFLGWEHVDCLVLDGVDPENIEAITIAENVFRNALTPEQLKKGLIRWRAIYEKHRASAEALGEPQKPFSSAVQANLRVSARTARRLAATAKNLSESDIDVLSAKNLTPTQIDQIAAIGDAAAIENAVKLIGSGMNLDEAVRQARAMIAAAAPAPAEPGKAPAKKKRTRRPSAASPASPLTDDDWLRDNCAMTLCTLKHKTAFKRDAILYHRMQEILAKFRGQAKKHLEEAKDKGGGNGSFFANVFRVANIAHPMHWLVCGLCMGTGKNKDDEKRQCPGCYGAAYKAKLED